MATGFTLTERQEKELKEWQEKIKELFGKYGHYDYIFTPYGMGTGLKVKSHITGIELDLSHEEDW
jgi:hypothetical protein